MNDRHSRMTPAIAGSTVLTAAKQNRLMYRLESAARRAEMLTQQAPFDVRGGSFTEVIIETRTATKFTAKKTNASGAGVGNAFDVYAFTVPSGADLTKCLPNIVVGDRIPVTRAALTIAGVKQRVYVVATCLAERCP